MKILVGVDISPRVVEALRRAGYDAIRTTDVMDARSLDEDVRRPGDGKRPDREAT